MIKIIFVCKNNSSQSIIAEAILNDLDRNRFHALSAGSSPLGIIHPWILRTLQRYEIPIDGYRSKSRNEFTDEHIDIVITVCDPIMDNDFPLFLKNPIKVHWDTHKPVCLRGDVFEQAAEFEYLYCELRSRIINLLKLPLELMSKEEATQKLRGIGGNN